MNETSIIKQFHSFLTGGTLPPKFLHVRDEIINKNVLNFMLLVESLYPLHPELEKKLTVLTAEQLYNVATAPHLSMMIFNKHIDVGVVLTTIHGELARENPDIQQDNLWTPLGDWNFSDGVTYATDIPLDFDSLWLTPTQAVRAKTYSKSERQQFAREIDEALIFAREKIPEIYHFIRAFVKVLQIRQEMWSFQISSMDWAGKVYLGSPSLGQNPVYWLDILYHEAIHNCLFLTEEFEHIFLDQTPMATAPHTWILSPWTGACITAHSYAHATIVWYGLWSLSKRLEAVGEFADSVEALRIRCSFGFRKKGFLGSLFTQKQQSCLNPNYASSLISMQKHVAESELKYFM